jgi:peptidase S58-like protein
LSPAHLNVREVPKADLTAAMTCSLRSLRFFRSGRGVVAIVDWNRTVSRASAPSVARSSVYSRPIFLWRPALERVARRAALGIARGGTPGGNSSGDIFLAFSTANPVDLPQVAGPWRSLTFLNDELLDTVYLAAVEAVDEAVLNAMLAAGDTPTARPSGSLCRGLDADRLCAILRPLGLVEG